MVSSKAHELNGHSTHTRKSAKKIFDSVLEVTDNTPLVKLNQIPAKYGLQCNVYAKCEFLNGGDYIRQNTSLIENAERNGHLNEGTTLIAVASPIQAVGLAVVATVKGHKCILVIEGEAGQEIKVVLERLGVEVVEVSKVSGRSVEEAIKNVQNRTPNSWVLCKNSLKENISSGSDIIDDISEILNGEIALLVADTNSLAGTKGKGKNDKLQVVEVALKTDDNAAAHVERVAEKEALLKARELNRFEGILSGGISGANLAAALKHAKSLRAGENCVVVLPDGIRDYLGKFLCDEWMLNHGYLDEIPKAEKIVPKKEYTHKTNSPEYDPERAPQDAFQRVPDDWVYEEFSPEKRLVINNIAEAIGHTPMVRLQRLPKLLGIEAEIVVKLEFLNAGGSVKDRVALKMVEVAEKTGHLKPGMTIIEPSSGNTGVGLALISLIKGYRCIICMPEKMSKEKEVILKALGAVIVRTPTKYDFDHPESYIGVALRLQKEIPGSIILDQYRNLANPLAHYETTAEEIIYDCDEKVDAVVIGAGTGGTVVGIARKLKERLPQCQIIATDPVGSVLADPSNRNSHSYDLEGTGDDFVPAVLDRSLVTEWVKTKDADCFTTSRQLIRHEGILCGGSSGANVWAALHVAKRFKKGDRVVVILPDGVRNYLSKFLDDEWLTAKGYPTDDPLV
ncbi:pyridoxal-phosphate dependent enzyme domain-containing protein [Ditylenchus destructor]|nr:pyridoxal-phosphate dependent enzyme domain-containing protein [Ditylenchus destructor]